MPNFCSHFKKQTLLILVLKEILYFPTLTFGRAYLIKTFLVEPFEERIMLIPL